MEKNLSPHDLKKLRDASLLAENETALRIGDIIVAENVVTKQRRVLDVSSLLLESNKRVLKG
jgi:hypothetical protein